LWSVAQQAWQERPVSHIARSYVGHHQIVNAIIWDKGGDQFAREKGGLHCGIRKAFVPCFQEDEHGNLSEHATGVQLFEVPDEVEADKLKYETPQDIDSYDDTIHKYLRHDEVEFLVKASEGTEQFDKFFAALMEFADKED
jgi:hypothetical protein